MAGCWAQVKKQLEAKIELLRGNLEAVRAEAEEAARLRETVQLLKGQLEAAAPPPDVAQMQAEIRHLKQRLASRASMADQELQVEPSLCHMGPRLPPPPQYCRFRLLAIGSLWCRPGLRLSSYTVHFFPTVYDHHS